MAPGEENVVTTSRWSDGSCWLRWDPHLHTPGTLLNDQFDGDWDGYFRAIEAAQPAPIALGITDYFTLRGYKEFLQRRPAGALASVELVFPNVEIRLTTETRQGQGINLHLLVSPDDPDHVARIEEKLSRLSFRYRDDSFLCTDDGLRRLGRAHPDNASLPDDVALREGANQFKVELNEVRRLFEEDAWVRANVLVGVAAGNDGLAGIAKDSGFRAHREELGRFADVVFSGQPKDRSYWLGGHPDFAANGQTVKPCLHGSDAHDLNHVLRPDLDRRCWIRGAPTFESLRQTLVEADRRTHIGAEPPPRANAAEVIHSLRLAGAPWVQEPELSFNSGLVTVIGAKGSGKTALADLIAFAAGAEEDKPGPASFLGKARLLLRGLRADLRWADGTEESGYLPTEPEATANPRVQYLSQQFVERLAAPGDLTEPLVQEIERVVFSAIPEEERLQTSTFSELRDVVLEGLSASRNYERESIRTQTAVVATEQALDRALPALKVKILAAERARVGLEREIASIPVKGGDENVKAHQAAATALQILKDAIAASDRRAQELRDVRADIRRQVQSADGAWEELKQRYPTLLDAATWETLKPRIDPSAMEALIRLEREARDKTAALRERGLAPGGPAGAVAGASSASAGLEARTAERDRLAKALGLNELNAKRRVDLEKRLVTARVGEAKAIKDLTHAEGAAERLKEAQRKRLTSYETVFGTLAAEQQGLETLYAPLRQRIGDDSRLSKLSFVVGRVVDVDAWAARGENLLDLRTLPFIGRGSIAEAARSSLLGPWKNGTPDDVRIAMRSFLEQHFAGNILSLAQGVTPLDVGEWLFSTDHISVRYSIEYEGVGISQLSPGTRGVVLLTLYLALDQWDLRPLIIDQPEENLDPSSVYDDLVPFFRDAANRRQIIMVTHNANLVVNTDSDQVIVAEARRTSPKLLPRVTYVAGGLEDPAIRAHVCRLLEGGEAAFRKRGERYGVTGPHAST